MGRRAPREPRVLRLVSAAQLVRQVHEVDGFDVGVGVGQEISSPAMSFLEWSFDECGSQAVGLRCAQVFSTFVGPCPAVPKTFGL